MLWCWGTFTEAVVSILGKSVPGKPVPVPQSRKPPVAFWYRYQHVIFAGFEQNSNLGERAPLSFVHDLEITKEKGGEEQFFYYRVLCLIVRVLLSHFCLGS